MPKLGNKKYSYDKEGMAKYKRDKKKMIGMKDGGRCRGAGKATQGAKYKVT